MGETANALLAEWQKGVSGWLVRIRVVSPAVADKNELFWEGWVSVGCIDNLSELAAAMPRDIVPVRVKAEEKPPANCEPWTIIAAGHTVPTTLVLENKDCKDQKHGVAAVAADAKTWVSQLKSGTSELALPLLLLCHDRVFGWRARRLLAESPSLFVEVMIEANKWSGLSKYDFMNEELRPEYQPFGLILREACIEAAMQYRIFPWSTLHSLFCNIVQSAEEDVTLCRQQVYDNFVQESMRFGSASEKFARMIKLLVLRNATTNQDRAFAFMHMCADHLVRLHLADPQKLPYEEIAQFDILLRMLGFYDENGLNLENDSKEHPKIHALIAKCLAASMNALLLNTDAKAESKREAGVLVGLIVPNDRMRDAVFSVDGYMSFTLQSQFLGEITLRIYPSHRCIRVVYQKELVDSIALAPAISPNVPRLSRWYASCKREAKLCVSNMRLFYAHVHNDPERLMDRVYHQYPAKPVAVHRSDHKGALYKYDVPVIPDNCPEWEIWSSDMKNAIKEGRNFFLQFRISL